MKISLHLPINATSFGQLSIAILKEIKKRGISPNLFLIGNPDFSSQKHDPEFQNWVGEAAQRAINNHSRHDLIFKLWHLNGSLESFSNNQVLLTFQELDTLTPAEINVIKNNHRVLVTTEYTKNIFETYGVKNVEKIPLFFDSENFKKKDKKYFNDDRVSFLLCGKMEKRKRHVETIRAWISKYGNNPKYSLRCALYNHFLTPEDNQKLVNFAVENKKYFNVEFLNFMTTNEIYNDFLNSGDVIIGASGAEGWDLPTFQAMCLGKHAVCLNAHAYKEYANETNAFLFNPNGKIPAVDGIFFHPNQPFNQGNIFTWDAGDFLLACDSAVRRAQISKNNENGAKLQEKFTVSKTVDQILSYF